MPLTVGQENANIDLRRSGNRATGCTDSWISIEWTFLGEAGLVLPNEDIGDTYDRRGFGAPVNPHLAMTTIPSPPI